MDEPSRAPTHDAPPPWRPLSAGAVTALVLAIALAPFAFLGPWWLEVLPLVVGAASWWAIADGRRRGRGVAVAACVIAVLAGTASLVVLGGWRAGAETHIDGFLQALAKDDRRQLAGWVLKGEDGEATVSRWRERMEAAERAAGPYGQRVVVDWGLLGPVVGVLVAPSGDLEEIGAPPGAPPSKPKPGAVWFQAGFAREILWAAVEVGRDDAPLDPQDVNRFLSGDRVPVVRAVRFLRPRARS